MLPVVPAELFSKCNEILLIKVEGPSMVMKHSIGTDDPKEH
jgi:hypothetical protein